MAKKTLFTYLYSVIFIFYIVLWVLLFLLVPKHDSVLNDHFADTYGILAGLGGLAGLYVARTWGGFKSYVGKSVIFLSLGLLFQFLGQLSYTFLFYVFGNENAYPSFGEIFFLGSIPLYLLGIYYIAKASGFTLTFKSYKGKITAIAFPIVMLFISYFLFLRNYEAEGLPFSIVFLDYVYPLGQALFLSLAMLTYYFTKGVLGGVMRNRVIFILFSLFFQYIADSLFIYETRTEVWYAGGLSDLMFMLSYSLMTVGLIKFAVSSIQFNSQKQQ